ncbi:MAG: DUF4238 domain-containing protein [Gammaproteobacteria bacterium]|nr:DUF4238 domain-containing protein [Gammaproteobacteria bacterium]MYI77241.1 DUF4238 domain-containing protein [Gammaproteobacteria bacterium]
MLSAEHSDVSNKLSQRNHTIPQFQIKNWADAAGKVWVLDNETQEIYQCATTNVFVEKNIYTTRVGPDAEKSDVYERWFATFESQVAPLFRDLVERARLNQPSELSPLDILLFKGFLVLQTWRTTESQNRIVDFDSEYFSEVSRNQRDFDIQSMNTLKTGSIFLTDEEFTRFEESNFQAKFAAGELPGQTTDFYEFAEEHGLVCWVISNPRRSVLLGSHGCCFIEKKGTNGPLVSPPMFPVAPDIVLTFSECPNKFNRLGHQTSRAEDKFVKNLNKATIKYSKRVVAKDKELLEKYRRC